MADILNKFVEKLREVYKENIVSIILYGSKASTDDAGKNSDYNLLLILNEVSPGNLPNLGKGLAGWISKGNSPPLIFSKDEFLASNDVFPIEFSDIKDNHRILYGEDVVSPLNIQDTHLRHECEFELRSKLLRIRQAYMASLGKESKIKGILFESISSLLVLFKSVIKLYGKVPSASKLSSLDTFKELSGIDTEIFKKVYSFKKGDKAGKNLNLIMDEYIIQLEKIIRVVDKL